MKRALLAALLVAAASFAWAPPAQAATKDAAIVGQTAPYYGAGSCNSVTAGPIKVKLGDTVRWKNCDIIDHTVTGAGFDSKHIASGASYSIAFNVAGTFQYGCTIHPEMTGEVVVVAPTTTLPPPTSTPKTTTTTTTAKPATTTSSSTSTSTTQTTVDVTGVFDSTTSSSSTSSSTSTTDASHTDSGGGGSSGLLVALLILGIAGIGGALFYVYRRMQQENV